MVFDPVSAVVSVNWEKQKMAAAFFSGAKCPDDAYAHRNRLVGYAPNLRHYVVHNDHAETMYCASRTKPA